MTWKRRFPGFMTQGNDQSLFFVGLASVPRLPFPCLRCRRRHPNKSSVSQALPDDALDNAPESLGIVGLTPIVPEIMLV